MAQPTLSSVNTLAPLLGGSMLVGCSKTWLVKAVPSNMSQRWLSTNTDCSNTIFHTMVLFCILICKGALLSCRTNVENQILKTGFTSREIVILENDDPGGVFEFSPVSRGPWFINVRIGAPISFCSFSCTYTNNRTFPRSLCSCTLYRRERRWS